jgi:tol-pal system protein YbgF
MIRRRKNTGKTGRTAFCLSLFAALIFFVPGVASAQQDQQARIDHLENEIQTLSRAVFKGDKPPADIAAQMQGGQGGAGQANMEVRLTQMETEIQTLTGKVEQQGYEQQQLQKSLNDLAARMGQSGAIAPTGAPPPAVSSAPATGPASGFDAELYGSPAATGAAVLATPPLHMDNPNAAAPPNAPTAGTLGKLEQSPSGTTTTAASDPTAQYEQAFSLLRDRKYDDAEKDFTAFLAQNPDSNLAANAQYWLGETFYARNNFERAARVFAESYQKYPKGPKGPDSLLKLAMSLAGMGKKDDACLTITQLRQQYTTGAGAVLARADQESAALGCH